MLFSYGKSLIIPPIGAILLDVENFPHLLDVEKQIKPYCKYPITIKYAAANWSNNTIAKLDLYLHKQRYRLFHVPQAKNAADIQLLAVGYSLISQYPHCQELTIVSNDSIFNYLHQSFQAQGYNTYKVYQQSGNIYFYDFRYDRTILISPLANTYQTERTQFKKETTSTYSEDNNLVDRKSNNKSNYSTIGNLALCYDRLENNDLANSYYINAINKNIPFILSSACPTFKVALANKNPVTSRRAIEINR